MSTHHTASQRPLLTLVLAIAAVLTITAGVAHAACGTIACDSRPIVIPPAPESIVLPPQPAAPALVSTSLCNACSAPKPVCTTCTDPRLQPTSLPGVYSNDFDYAVTSQRNTTGFPYLIPTASGLLESPTIPLTNPVDRYYATHRVINNQVVRTAPTPPNLAVTSQFNQTGQTLSVAYAAGSYRPGI